MADTITWVEYDFAAVAQGSRWTRFVRLWQDAAKTLPVDFTGASVKMHIREGVADSGAAVKAELSSAASSDDPQRIFFPPADSNGLPVEGGAEDRTSGFLMLDLEAAASTAILPTKLPKRGSLAEAMFYYDLEITDSLGVPRRRMRGQWPLSLEVTR